MAQVRGSRTSSLTPDPVEVSRDHLEPLSGQNSTRSRLSRTTDTNVPLRTVNRRVTTFSALVPAKDRVVGTSKNQFR